MLNDLSFVIQPEDVNPRPVAVVRPVLIAVQDDEVAVGQDATELHALAGILARHPLEVFDEGVLAVRDNRIVLGVRRTHVTAHGFSRL